MTIFNKIKKTLQIKLVHVNLIELSLLVIVNRPDNYWMYEDRIIKIFSFSPTKYFKIFSTVIHLRLKLSKDYL